MQSKPASLVCDNSVAIAPPIVGTQTPLDRSSGFKYPHLMAAPWRQPVSPAAQEVGGKGLFAGSDSQGMSLLRAASTSRVKVACSESASPRERVMTLVHDPPDAAKLRFA